MYPICRKCVYPYYTNMLMYNLYQISSLDKRHHHTSNPYMYGSNLSNTPVMLKDYGPDPLVLNIDKATKQNNTFRTALWTGENFQVTLMSIDVGDDIGLEIHRDVDQFIRIEEGSGIVMMGDTKDMLDFQEKVYNDYAIVIPAGKWHNLINTGDIPLKIYAIYAPPEHPYGTIHETKADALEDEEND